MTDNLTKPTRPPKLPFAAARVVKACGMLDDSHKLLWLEHVALDGKEGAYIGAGGMAQRLSKSSRSVERGRAELVRLGMLTAGRVGRGQTATWFPTLPSQCIPLIRPTVAEVSSLAEKLDCHIRAVRAGDIFPPTGKSPRPRENYLTPEELAEDTPDTRDRTPDARVGTPPTLVTAGTDTRDTKSAPPSGENRAQSTDARVGGGAPEVGEVQVGEVQSGENLQPAVGEPVFDRNPKAGEQRASQGYALNDLVDDVAGKLAAPPGETFEARRRRFQAMARKAKDAAA